MRKSLEGAGLSGDAGDGRQIYRDLGVLFNFIEISPVYMHIYCNDKIVYANHAVLDKLGYTLDEIRELNFWDIVHDTHKERVIEIGRVRQQGGMPPRKTEMKVVTRAGRELWMDVFSSAEVISGQLHVIVGGYDITARKEAEMGLQKAHDQLEERVSQRTNELQAVNDKLREQQQMLMGIVSNISNGVLILNNHGEIEFCNPTLEKMFGMPGESVAQSYKSGKLAMKSYALDRIWQDDQEFKDEEAVVTLGRKEWRFLISGTPIANRENGVKKVILVFRTISEVHKLVNRISGAVARFKFDDIITRSEPMQELVRTAKAASKINSNIMLEGESGTGKEVFAQAIHNHSPRAGSPFIAVNCGAIPRELIGSELFGYESGAFTGARKEGNPGRFELAEGGTLFLDEIGDMPLEQQVSLLRVLQEKQITRIGGTKVIPIDVRIICATNRNLFIEVQKGRFRQDLYYRLNVISLRIPPLRERREDIQLLLKAFLGQSDPEWEAQISRLDPAVINTLIQYDWPGNVRELQNVAERIAYSHENYQVPAEKLLDGYGAPDRHRDLPPLPGRGEPETTSRETGNVKLQRSDFEKECILKALEQSQGNVSQAARDMGIARRTLYRKIKQYELTFR